MSPREPAPLQVHPTKPRNLHQPFRQSPTVTILRVGLEAHQGRGTIGHEPAHLPHRPLTPGEHLALIVVEQPQPGPGRGDVPAQVAGDAEGGCVRVELRETGGISQNRRCILEPS